MAGAGSTPKLFHAAIDMSGPMRLNRPLALPPPDFNTIKAQCDLIDGAMRAVEQGLGKGGSRAERSGTVAKMVAAFAAAAADGGNADACVGAAIDAARGTPFMETLPAGTIITPFTEMLEGGRWPSAARAVQKVPVGEIAKGLEALIAIEVAAGASVHRRAAPL